MSKIILGTAQFGSVYGINNKRGQVSQEEAFAILDEAHARGITLLDTASAYGASEEVIGQYLKKSGKSFSIISKLPECSSAEVEGLFERTLTRLRGASIAACLIHNFSHYEADKKIWKKLEDLKRQGKIKKIGFSLYRPMELAQIFKDGLSIDVIQVPCNVFDQRFCDSLTQLKAQHVEVHVRSAFLQGLVFATPAELYTYFAPIKEKLETLHHMSRLHKIPVFALCLNFLFSLEGIDAVVVGVDGLEHFRQLLTFTRYEADSHRLTRELTSLRESDENMILPYLWKTANA